MGATVGNPNAQISIRVIDAGDIHAHERSSLLPCSIDPEAGARRLVHRKRRLENAEPETAGVKSRVRTHRRHLAQVHANRIARALRRLLGFGFGRNLLLNLDQLAKIEYRGVRVQ
jgi:hypothetical protein